jgi:hypothetical protein
MQCLKTPLSLLFSPVSRLNYNICVTVLPALSALTVWHVANAQSMTVA